jgi:CelD/BcsL family acetyltransferase involved in cellulose biosynthesis
MACSMTIQPDFEIVSDPARLVSLETEWNDLWRRADRPYAAQGFAWCLAGWRTTGSVRRRRLHVVVMREAGQAVLIWPMTLRRRLAWSVATALGAEGTEYAPVLVESGADEKRRVQAAWSFIRGKSGADIVDVPFARAGSAVEAVLAADPALCAIHTLASPFVCFDRGASWQDYWRSRSANLRNGCTRRRRRLAEQGSVTIEWVDDMAEYAGLLDWTLAHKGDWMARNNMHNGFLDTPEFRTFMLSSAQGADDGSPGMAMMVLRLDGKPIATKIGSLDGSRFEGFITTYDVAYTGFSPGQIILAECLEWCQAKGLDYDFRVGDEAYKLHWATGNCAATTFRIASTRWGMVLVRGEVLARRLREVKDRIRLCIPPSWRRSVKSVLRLAFSRRPLAELRAAAPFHV